MVKTLRIGTRGSKLALWQAEYTKARLKEIGIPSELIIIKTQGDKIQHLSFDKLEGKRFFTKEIEDALLAGTIDMAVHSMKDMPTQSPDGLTLSAVSYREDPSDWLFIRKEVVVQGQLLKLPQGAVVGTSSARRKAQMMDLRNDIVIQDIRGNVPTRLNKLAEGEFDAILLAAAGVTRLALPLDAFEVLRFSPKEFVPAPAQGVLCWQTKSADIETRKILRAIHDPDILNVIRVERKVLSLLEGGCQMPLGVYCERDTNGHYQVWAAKADQWNAPVKRVHISSSTHFELAEQVVEALQIK